MPSWRVLYSAAAGASMKPQMTSGRLLLAASMAWLSFVSPEAPVAGCVEQPAQATSLTSQEEARGQQATSEQADVARRLSRRASERIRALQVEAEALANQERTLLGDLRRLELERDARAEELAALELEMRSISLEQEQLLARRASLEERASVERPLLNARLVELYKLGRGGYMRLLLGVESLRKAGRAYRTVAHVAHSDRMRVESYRETIASLEEAERAMAARIQQLSALQEKAMEARQEAARAIARRNALVSDIDRRRDLAARYIGELQDAERRLAALLSGGSGEAGPVLLPIGPFRGALEWPVDGRVTRTFGARTAVPGAGAAHSSGVSIAAAAGSPVRAVHVGVVTHAEPFTGFGTLVVLDHGQSAFSVYGHLLQSLVQRGALVERGQVIGTVGRAPAGNPELYFEMRVDGRPVDPLQWLEKR